jgi:hypothetical protein
MGRSFAPRSSTLVEERRSSRVRSRPLKDADGGVSPMHANVMALQRLVGNRQTARLLQRHERPEADVQRVVKGWQNTDTKKDFDVKIGEGKYPVEASERRGKQNGYADYRMEGEAMTLHTIVAEPEEGTNLGSLMMWYLAQDAVEKKAKVIEITRPATFAVGFYEQLGAEAAHPQAARALREELSSPNEFPAYWDRIVTEHARRQYEREHYADEKYQSWAALDEGERKKRIAAKRDEMNKSDAPSRLLRKIHKYISDRAVAATGLMRANPETMLRCAEASKAKRWAELPK